jgi:hypothetical protein
MREAQRIRSDVLLDRCAHLRRSVEETISWDQPFEALVRALEVVRLDE